MPLRKRALKISIQKAKIKILLGPSIYDANASILQRHCINFTMCLHGEAPPYPAEAVSGETVCYDLSYGLKPTPFSTWAREHGAARSVMGWGMLVEQAAESFRIWRNVSPDTAEVLKRMTISA